MITTVHHVKEDSSRLAGILGQLSRYVDRNENFLSFFGIVVVLVLGFWIPRTSMRTTSTTRRDTRARVLGHLASFCGETGLFPRSASRCQMIARVERALRRTFNKRAQERPLHLAFRDRN